MYYITKNIASQFFTSYSACLKYSLTRPMLYSMRLFHSDEVPQTYIRRADGSQTKLKVIRSTAEALYNESICTTIVLMKPL